MTITLRRAAVVSVATLSLCCITTFNKPKLTPAEGAPEVLRRADGCNVDVYQDGEAVPRKHADLGAVELDWPQKKIEEQGPEGAIATLKAFACEKGAFVVKDLRVLAMGVGEGMIYQATFATLLDDDGRPLNAKSEPASDGGPAGANCAPTDGGGC